MTGEIAIDTSALIAILLGEPEAERLGAILAGNPRRQMSAFTHIEASTVIAARKGPEGLLSLDALLMRLRVEIVPLTHEQALLAREAYQRFGKGRHPAGLNLGDCCSYALAKHRGLPLLFKGEDFPKTDIQAAG